MQASCFFVECYSFFIHWDVCLLDIRLGQNMENHKNNHTSYPTAKWWLISDEDVKRIRLGLKEGTYGTRIEGLHALDSGLHKTDEIPEDWK